MTQDNGHTPGPWFSDEAGICADGWGVVASLGWPSAVWDREGFEPTDSERAVVQANARLIAAAPALLEALEEMVDACSQVWTAAEFPALAKPRAALLQARGEAG